MRAGDVVDGVDVARGPGKTGLGGIGAGFVCAPAPPAATAPATTSADTHIAPAARLVIRPMPGA